MGEQRKGLIQSQLRIAGDHCYAYLARGYRCQVELAAIVPMHLNQVRVLLHAKMTPKPKAPGGSRRRFQPGPAAHKRVLAIRPNYPSRAKVVPSDRNAV